MSKPSAQQIALACGVSGAYVDVTDDLVTDSIQGSWGRTSAFSDTRPGVFSFDLSNDTGKYTPGNPASTLSTPVRVGMGVSHIVDGMHFAGTIRSAEPYFTGPASLSGSSKLRVTCDDMLGNAARRRLLGLNESAFSSSGPLLHWPFDEVAGATAFAETWAGYPSLPVATVSPTGTGTMPYMTAGSTTSHIPADQVLKIDAASQVNTNGFTFPNIDYGTTTLGAWGCWLERDDSGAEIAVAWQHAGLAITCNIRTFAGNLTMRPGVGTRITGPAMVANTPYYCAVVSTTTFAAGLWTITYTFYVNGVSYGSSVFDQTAFGPAISSLTAAQRQLSAVRVDCLGSTAGNFYIAELTHTRNLVNLYPNQDSTAAVRLQAIAAVVPEVVLDAIPTMSTSVLARSDTNGQSALDAFNDVIRSEQGYIWAETTGALTTPTQKVKVRGRDRGATVDAAHTFTVTEVQNAPDFTTDIEDMVASATASGPVASMTAIDSSLVPYVGSASDSTQVLLRDSGDLLAWAQDRLIRGNATGVRLTRVTLDALGINRWADVSALRAGDRVRVTDLPSTQLGVSYIDGWLLGCTYSLRYPSLHGEDQMLFTFYLQPVLADTAVFDTNRFMSGGEMTVNTTFNSAVTSISIASTGQLFTTSTDLPTTIRIDGEVLTVSAVSGASSPQTFTVARGATDPLTGLATTAASHTAGALVEIATPSLFAF